LLGLLPGWLHALQDHGRILSEVDCDQREDDRPDADSADAFVAHPAPVFDVAARPSTRPAHVSPLDVGELDTARESAEFLMEGWGLEAGARTKNPTTATRALTPPASFLFLATA
jgi:hypothetical protein